MPDAMRCSPLSLGFRGRGRSRYAGSGSCPATKADPSNGSARKASNGHAHAAGVSGDSRSPDPRWPLGAPFWLLTYLRSYGIICSVN